MDLAIGEDQENVILILDARSLILQDIRNTLFEDRSEVGWPGHLQFRCNIPVCFKNVLNAVNLLRLRVQSETMTDLLLAWRDCTETVKWILLVGIIRSQNVTNSLQSDLVLVLLFRVHIMEGRGIIGCTIGIGEVDCTHQLDLSASLHELSERLHLFKFDLFDVESSKFGAFGGE